MRQNYDKAIKSGELTPLADFKLYSKTADEIQEKLIGIETANGIKIESNSAHLISRAIGSVEQKRSGVSVDTMKEALLKPSEIKGIVHNANGDSQRFVLNGKCIVSVNPTTGRIIQVNPYMKKGK